MKSCKTLCYTSILLALAACGGGGSSSSDTPSNEAVKNTGVFLDSAVVNIGYRTETLEGVTNSLGEYEYLNGENVIFFIGDLEFPVVPATGVVTPLELTETKDVTNPTVVNIMRLLQSLDRDGNLDNGLFITDLAKSSATQVDFTLTNSEFESSFAVTSLIINAGQDDVVTELVDPYAAIAHFSSTIQNNSLMEEYCEIDSDRYGSIFTTHTNDCKQKKYRDVYYDLLLPIFYQLGQMSNSNILSEITVTQLRRDTVSQILNAKKLIKYTKLVNAASTTGASKEAVKAVVGETADLIGGSIAQSLGGMAGNEEYGNIWYGVLRSYADAPAAILGDPGAIASLVESQVDSLWKIGSDTLASWKLSNLTEQSNELQLTQYTLEFYYSNFADNLKLLEALELNGSFDWREVVDKVAQLKGYENSIFSEDYSTDKVVQQVQSYINMIEKVVDVDSLFSDSSSVSSMLVTEEGGNDRSALISPNGGEIWQNSENQMVSWRVRYITGSTVDLYVLHDDPSGLYDRTNQNIGEIVNSKRWFKFASSIPNIGSYDLDPSEMGGSGNAYMVLVVSTVDNSQFDISDSTFSLNDLPDE